MAITMNKADISCLYILCYHTAVMVTVHYRDRGFTGYSGISFLHVIIISQLL